MWLFLSLSILVADPPTSTLKRDYHALLNNPKYSDVKFIVEGKTIHAHLGNQLPLNHIHILQIIISYITRVISYV